MLKIIPYGRQERDTDRYTERHTQTDGGRETKAWAERDMLRQRDKDSLTQTERQEERQV